MKDKEPSDRAVLRLARRIEDILGAARERERRGQRLALEIDARFQLHDAGAVQFQLASAILEEIAGLKQEEVISELLSLGLAAVLDGATRVAYENARPASTAWFTRLGEPSSDPRLRDMRLKPDGSKVN